MVVMVVVVVVVVVYLDTVHVEIGVALLQGIDPRLVVANLIAERARVFDCGDQRIEAVAHLNLREKKEKKKKNSMVMMMMMMMMVMIMIMMIMKNNNNNNNNNQTESHHHNHHSTNRIDNNEHTTTHQILVGLCCDQILRGLCTFENQII